MQLVPVLQICINSKKFFFENLKKMIANIYLQATLLHMHQKTKKGRKMKSLEQYRAEKLNEVGASALGRETFGTSISTSQANAFEAFMREIIYALATKPNQVIALFKRLSTQDPEFKEILKTSGFENITDSQLKQQAKMAARKFAKTMPSEPAEPTPPSEPNEF